MRGQLFTAAPPEGLAIGSPAVRPHFGHFHHDVARHIGPLAGTKTVGIDQASSGVKLHYAPLPLSCKSQRGNFLPKRALGHNKCRHGAVGLRPSHDSSFATHTFPLRPDHPVCFCFSCGPAGLQARDTFGSKKCIVHP